MAALRTVILGGYGLFGRRLAQRLGRMEGLQVVVGGRSHDAASACARGLRPGAQAEFEAAAIDLDATDFSERLRALQPDLVIHAAGPFQGQDYRVAQACMAAGADYVDLADGREFVRGIGALDGQARRMNVRVVSGASSVPALSGAVCDQLAQGFAQVQHIDIGICPGNRTERGLATVRSILGYCGQPIRSRFGPPGLVGWRGTWRHRYGDPVGWRLLSPCDVPDLDLLGDRYPANPTVRFGAGLELRILHRGMNLLAWMADRGWVTDWSRHASVLQALANVFLSRGSDAGAMHVRLAGRTASGEPRIRTWELLALAGDGPFVPVLAAAALVRKRLTGQAGAPGARPCLGLLSLDEFAVEAAGLQIRWTEDAA